MYFDISTADAKGYSLFSPDKGLIFSIELQAIKKTIEINIEI